MDVVSTHKQVEKNIRELERGRKGTSVDQAAYRSLIKRGTCFLPYINDNGLAFAPSRFIGYVANSTELHAANRSKDGRVTNVALSDIYGCSPVEDEALEVMYQHFCASVGVTPSRTGTFGVVRKYWVTSETSKLLSDQTEVEIKADPSLSETTKKQLIDARIGQGAFRRNLVSKWKDCMVTGCSYESILRASHIKPWRVSDNVERLDVFNGLLLSPNFDALFDKGLISFSDQGKIMISPRLSVSVRETLGSHEDMTIPVVEQHLPYLLWHRKNLFKSKDS